MRVPKGQYGEALVSAAYCLVSERLLYLEHGCPLGRSFSQRRTPELPIYAYKCTKGHVYEKTEGFDAPARQKCAKCRSMAQRQISMPAVIFKGSGFYSTDNRKGGDGDSSSESGSSKDGSSSDSSNGGSSNGKSSDSGSSDSGSKSKAKTATTD